MNIQSKLNRRFSYTSLAKSATLFSALVAVAGRAEAQVWTPSNITVAAWYDAADAGTVLTSGSAVTNWLDKSGNNLHLRQGITANQPATGAAINSLNALDFTGDSMSTASNPFAPTVSNAFVIAVHKVDTLSMGTLFSLTDSDSNRWQSHAPYTSEMYFDCGGASGINRINTSYGVSAGNVVLVSFYCSTADNVQQVYKNGSILTNDSSGHAVSTGTGKIIVGGCTSVYQDTTLGEFIIINGTVSVATRQKMEGYLAHKWGLQANLPANHPYKNDPPLAIFSVTVTAPTNGQVLLTGSAVTATVAVEAGTAPYDVTFYTNGVSAWSTNNISATLFTIPLGTLGDGTYTNYAYALDATNGTAYSSTNTFTLAPDTTAPTPDPMTFAVNPTSRDTSKVVMTATTATDAFSPPVEYFFTNTVNGATSDWITSTVWTNSGLTEGVTYGYRVMARDAISNETAFSSVFTAVPADPTLFWDANNTGTNRTDGNGTWLNANQWWTGIANSTWNNTIPNDAVIGNGMAGGTITLGTVTAGCVTFTNFTGTYTLTGGSLTQSGGLTITPTAANVTIYTTLGGSGGFAKGGSGVLFLYNDGNSYTGPTVVTGGVLQVGSAWNQGSQSLPGGVSNNGNSGSNLEINGGNVRLAYYLRRALGAGPGQLQLTGGISGFSCCQGSTPGENTIKLNNDLNYEIVWGSAYWNPSVLVLNDAAAGATVQIELGNKINLNGATRTVAANSASQPGRITGVIRHGSGTAGLTKTGSGELQLTAANTFNGPVTVSQGTLSLGWIGNVNSANPLGQSSAAATNLVLANGTTLKYTGGAASCNRGFTINGTADGHSATIDASGTGALVLSNTASPEYGTGNQSRKLILTGTSTSTNTLAASIADNGSGKVSLTKTGAGTWVLTGNNSYSGDTIVTNGILRITGEKVLSPLTSVYLSTVPQTGKIDLAFTGTQRIAALYINGVKQSIGTPVGANGTTITGTGFLGKSNGGMVILIR